LGVHFDLISKGVYVFSGFISISGFSAVLWAASSSGILAIMWVLVRQLSNQLHPLEITFFATLFGFLFSCFSIFKFGLNIFKTTRLTHHFYRGCINGIAISAWFTSLTLLTLADASALNLMSPLCVSIGAVFVLNEYMGPRRWFALGLGALGVLVVVRPGFEEVNLGVWLVAITVLASAGQRLFGKSLVATDNSTTCVLYLTLFMMPVALIAATFVWKWPAFHDYLYLILIGGLLNLGHYALMKSLSLADVSALEPVNFTRLVWGALFGFWFFNEIPDLYTWIGGFMIISATSYVAHREAQIRKNNI
jgi:drug/metabolite transporter (DMT)-like permease